MADIKNSPNAPMWPWGPPADVRERIVQPGQVDRKRKSDKKGNPKNPPLASMELLNFIGPGHSSDELRLPEPPLPPGHDADLDGFIDRPHLAQVSARADEESHQALESGIDLVNAAPERRDRLKALAKREAQMLSLVQVVHDWIREVDVNRRAESRDEGF